MRLAPAGPPRPRSVSLVLFPVAMAALAMLAACSSNPKMPKGPAPEYEDPPAPSWLDGGADASPASPPSIAPAPGSEADAGTI